jgi:putative transcriptional regulator
MKGVKPAVTKSVARSTKTLLVDQPLKPSPKSAATKAPPKSIGLKARGAGGGKTKIYSVRKATKATPRSDAFEAVHSAAADLHAVGAIDKKTMREFDESCLRPPSFDAQDVLRIRRKVHVSQEVLARYMGITKSTVVKWESAENTPSPMAQRLLKIIDKLGIDALI